MTLDPKKRTFSEKPDLGKVREVDAAARAQRLQILGWSLAAGIPIGGGLGFLVGHPILGVLLGPALVYAGVGFVVRMAGKGAGTVYMPSGSSTPRKMEYSRAKALEIRGQHMEAVKAYEVAILESPETAEPYLCIARLFRDNLKELDLAIHWFRRAQREATLSTGEAIRTHRELAEVFLHHRREPRRAAPELAKLAEGYPGTLDGEWAARELAAIKEDIAREREEDSSASGEEP
jgi:tetratricopeptide (TPR) repeat protein